MRDSIRSAIASYVDVPAHIAAIAGAAAYDLMNGPAWVSADVAPESFDSDDLATFPDDVDGRPIEFYTSPAADALRAFLEDMPSTLYVDDDCGCVIGETEPESHEDCCECDGTGLNGAADEFGADIDCPHCEGSGRPPLPFLRLDIGARAMGTRYDVTARELIAAVNPQRFATFYFVTLDGHIPTSPTRYKTRAAAEREAAKRRARYA